MAFALMRWRGGKLLFALSLAATAAANQWATFIGQGGFQLADGTFWAPLSIAVGAVGGLIWGPLSWYLGRGLSGPACRPSTCLPRSAVAGTSTPDSPPRPGPSRARPRTRRKRAP